MKRTAALLEHQLLRLREVHSQLLDLRWEEEAQFALRLAERCAALHERLLGRLRGVESYRRARS